MWARYTEASDPRRALPQHHAPRPLQGRASAPSQYAKRLSVFLVVRGKVISFPLVVREKLSVQRPIRPGPRHRSLIVHEKPPARHPAREPCGGLRVEGIPRRQFTQMYCADSPTSFWRAQWRFFEVQKTSSSGIHHHDRSQQAEAHHMMNIIQ